MCPGDKPKCRICANGVSRRGFFQAATGVAAWAMGSDLLDDVLSYAAESTGPVDTGRTPVVVDVVCLWEPRPATGQMDWGYGTDTYNYQRDLY
ncbi:MAG: hypothetical protein MUF48_23525, partial [Pirellulaceae bacterium]|nr:hypothetical protein [Pirellulaceae bacterium]